MSASAWIGVGLLATLVLYVLCLRLFVREGRELEKEIDYSKIKPWQDEDTTS